MEYKTHATLHKERERTTCTTLLDSRHDHSPRISDRLLHVTVAVTRGTDAFTKRLTHRSCVQRSSHPVPHGPNTATPSLHVTTCAHTAGKNSQPRRALLGRIRAIHPPTAHKILTDCEVVIGVNRHSNKHAPRHILEAQGAFKDLMTREILQFA